MKKPKKPAGNQNPRPGFFTYRLAMLEAIFIALGSALLTSQAMSNDWLWLELAGAVLIYLGALYLATPVNIVSVILFLALGFYFSGEMSFWILRIGIFASVLALTKRKAWLLPPYLTLLLMWIAMGFANSTLESYGLSPMFVANAEVASRLVLELVGVLILGLIASAPSIRTVFEGDSELGNSRTFFVHTMVITVLLTVALASSVILETTNSSIEPFLVSLLRLETLTVILFATVALLPLSIGLLLAQTITNSLSLLDSAIDPDKHRFRGKRDPLVIPELRNAFEEVGETMGKREEMLRSAEGEMRRLTTELRELRCRAEKHELMSDNLNKLLDRSPWGFLVCSTSGVILTASKQLCRALRIDLKETLGNDLSALVKKDRAWNTEITSFLSWACTNYNEVLSRKSVTKFSSSNGKHYLELTVRAIRIEKGENNKKSQPAADDIGIILYLRKAPDTRQFQLDALAPTPFDIIGSQLSRQTKEFQDQLSAVVGHLSIATNVVENPTNSTNREMELTLALNDARKVIEEIFHGLEKLEQRSKNTDKENAQIDLSTRFQHAIDYLHELLGLEQGSAVHILDTDNKEDAERIAITVNESDITKLYAYLLTLFKELLTQTDQIQISLAREVIDEQTAKFLNDALPGDYARINIEHAGQSITANMLASSFHELDLTSGALTPLHVALTLVHQQVARLRGFISATSNASKGTSVTIYLPVVPPLRSATETPARRSQKQFNSAMIEEEKQTAEDVLIIGSDNNATSALSNMLQHLGFRCEVKDPTMIEKPAGNSFEFSGSGFGTVDDETVIQEVDLTADESGDASVDLLIMNIENATERTLGLVHDLERQNPSAATLLIVEPNSAQSTMFADWAKLTRPFDIESLGEAIETALKKL